MSSIAFLDCSDGRNKEFNKGTIEVKSANSQKDSPLGKPVGIVLHWSAGYKNQVWDEYHFNVAEMYGLPVVVKTLKLSQKGQHLWKRNTGMIGVSISAMATTELTPSPAQCDATAILVAELCAWKQIDPCGEITLTGFDKTITMFAVEDHAAYAKVDGYFPDRWDIGKYFNVVMPKIREYYRDLKSGKRKFQFNTLFD